MKKFAHKLLKAFALITAVSVQMTAHAATEQPMDFKIDTSALYKSHSELMLGGVIDIYAEGDMTPGTTERFAEFVKKNDIKLGKVHFNSPGGNLLEGMKLGEKIRELGFGTSVGIYQSAEDMAAEGSENPHLSAICASSCSYAYVGGVNRFLSKYTGKLGVHQFYSDKDAGSVSETQVTSAYIVAYLRSMGIDANAFTLSTIANKDEVFWISPDLALKLKIANNGSETPTVEIQMSGMVPYLNIQQNHHNGIARVLLFCDPNKKIFLSFGSVSSVEFSPTIMRNAKRSYLDVDNKEILPVKGSKGLDHNGDTVYVVRTLSLKQITQFASATSTYGWVDSNGGVRFGARLDMPTVREKIIEYAKQCASS